MNKVVIGPGDRGFSLSKKAMLRLYELGYESTYYNKDIELIGYRFYPLIQRHDPRLIQVVEELGKEASDYSKLKIEEIEGNLYRIIRDSDGGYEYIETPNDIEWIEISMERSNLE